MNYLDFVTKYQTPSQPLPSTGDEEKDRKLMHAYELYAKDQPLSGTDPLGEFYVSGVVGGGAFKLVGSFLKRASTSVIKKAIELSGGKINKYLTSTGQWNTALIQKDIQQGILDARAFLSSDVKAATDLHNRQLAQRLGYKGFSPDAGIQRQSISPKSRSFTTNASSPSGYVERTFTNAPQEDKVVYNLNKAKDLKATAFHEELHRGNIGEGNVFDLTNSASLRTKLADTEAFETMKVNHLLKKDASIPYNEYLRADGEAAANILDVAYRAGVKPGTPFPGKQKVLEILAEIKQKFPEKAFVIDNLDTTHPKRIWDALTGKYFVGAPAIAAVELYDSTQQ